MSYCAYKDCIRKRNPCSKWSFFPFPEPSETDSRLDVWVQNSGNGGQKNFKPRSKILCEGHFHQCDLRVSVNRTILSKNAVPVPHEDMGAKAIMDDRELGMGNEITKKEKTSHEQEEEIEESETYECSPGLDSNSFNNKASYVTIEVDDCEDYKLDNSREEQNFFMVSEILEDDEIDLPTDSNEITEQEFLGKTEVEEINQSAAVVCDNETEKEEHIRPTTAIVSPLTPEPAPLEPTALSSMLVEIPENTRTRPEAHKESNSSCDYEEDKHFALSLVGYFQRLPKKKKALAKLKILSYLTELELE